MDNSLTTYIKEWNLSAPKLIAQTPTSHVYKVQKNDKDYVLKIYSDLGQIHEVMGPIFLQSCRGQGVVDVIDYNDEACLLEYIDGSELLSLVQNNQDDEATLIIAQTLNKIHKTPIPENHSFKPLKEHMHKLFLYSSFEDVPNIIKRAAEFAAKKLENQIEISLLHGDMHHKNLMHHSQKGWLALDPQAVVGDRAYDCANTLHNPHEMPQFTESKERLLHQTHILGKEMNIDPQRIIDYAYIHGALSSCWTKEDDGYYSQDVLNTSAILEPLISTNRK